MARKPNLKVATESDRPRKPQTVAQAAETWPRPHVPGCPWGAFEAWEAAGAAYSLTHAVELPDTGPLLVGDEPLACYDLHGEAPW